MENEKTGILEITDKGYGFLRSMDNNFASEPGDVYVSAKLISENYLREGCVIKGTVGDVRHSGQNCPLTAIQQVNDMETVEYRDVWEIRDRRALDPLEKFTLETGSDDMIGRAMDIFCPIGMGQRGLIVAPPKTGKTTCLKHIAMAIGKNHPDVQVIGLLIDERPEEVTDFARSTGCKMFSSSLDEKPEKHIRIAKLAFSVATRYAETGKDVVVLIDSLTRMTRAFNLRTHGRGKTLSGGIDAEALALPKRFFGAARNFEGKGSLSVIATILVDTGSRMDEVIFQEYKGTGNMELVLDRNLAERSIFPAINILQSGTRKEEKLLGADLAKVSMIRRRLSGFDEQEAIEEIFGAFRKTSSNAELLKRISG